MIENDSRPSWFCPATADEPSDVAAIQHGGCGSWNGFGVTMRVGNLKVGLSHSKYSSRHIAQMISMASAHSARLASRSTWNAVCSIGVERPVPHSTRPLREDVGGRHLLGDAGRVGEPVRQQRHAEAEPDVLGGLGERADHDLGRRAVRAALAEVVLDEPRDVEADLVGEPHLVEHLGVRALLALPLPVRVRPASHGRGESISYSRSSFTDVPPVWVSSHMG